MQTNLLNQYTRHHGSHLLRASLQPAGASVDCVLRKVFRILVPLTLRAAQAKATGQKCYRQSRQLVSVCAEAESTRRNALAAGAAGLLLTLTGTTCMFLSGGVAGFNVVRQQNCWLVQDRRMLERLMCPSMPR